MSRLQRRPATVEDDAVAGIDDDDDDDDDDTDVDDTVDKNNATHDQYRSSLSCLASVRIRAVNLCQCHA